MSNLLRELLSRHNREESSTDRYLFDLFNTRVNEHDSTGYFLRVVSRKEFDLIRKDRVNLGYRWFMMVNYRIPPQAVNWMLGKALGSSNEYSRAILLTPETVDRCEIGISEVDSDAISRWYPAVQLRNYGSVRASDVKDATDLVKRRMRGLNLDSGKVDIYRAINQPIPIWELNYHGFTPVDSIYLQA